MHTISSRVCNHFGHTLVCIDDDKLRTGELDIQLLHDAHNTGIKLSGFRVHLGVTLPILAKAQGELVRNASNGAHCRHHYLARSQVV
jgi:hypothetical protein